MLVVLLTDRRPVYVDYCRAAGRVANNGQHLLASVSRPPRGLLLDGCKLDRPGSAMPNRQRLW